jgi:multidrug efflux pump subunit AcrB
MTTRAAIFGTLPIAIGIGAGSDLRKPLGIAVVGDAFLRSYALKRLKLKRVNRMPND